MRGQKCPEKVGRHLCVRWSGWPQRKNRVSAKTLKDREKFARRISRERMFQAEGKSQCKGPEEGFRSRDSSGQSGVRGRERSE